MPRPKERQGTRSLLVCGRKQVATSLEAEPPERVETTPGRRRPFNSVEIEIYRVRLEGAPAPELAAVKASVSHSAISLSRSPAESVVVDLRRELVALPGPPRVRPVGDPGCPLSTANQYVTFHSLSIRVSTHRQPAASASAAAFSFRLREIQGDRSGFCSRQVQSAA